MDDDDKPLVGEVIDLFQPQTPRRAMPVRYNEELAHEIAVTYATTAKSLPTLCRVNKHWPARHTLFEWRLKYPDFDRAMDMARMERGADFLDESVEIADDASNDVLGGEPNPVSVARAKLRVDARQKWAVVVVPERYGKTADGFHSPNYLPQDEAIKHLK